MSKRYVIGDIHGGYKALIQCLQRCNFDYHEDVLISLGDICDGWSETYECVEELLKIKNLIAIKGNHDEWFNMYIKTGMHGSGWSQGAEATRQSYAKNCNMDIPGTHQLFFHQQLKYFIDEDNNLFVHGGFNRHYPINDQVPDYIYWWDRDLWLQALSVKDLKIKFKIHDNFKEIFIGHTTTMNWKIDKPMHASNIWNLDTGAGFKGKLTIMDIDTKEYWQSDNVQDLYFDEPGRNR